MKRILLVEDDILIARIYRRKLEDAGFRVTAVEDGLEAITLLPQCKPDLVVLDIMLPKLNGLDVLKFIRRNPILKSTVVVVFSNAFLNGLWEQITALGVQEILLKASVTPPQLVKIISKILEPAGASLPAPVKPGARESSSRKLPENIMPDGPVAAGTPENQPASPQRAESASGFRRRIRRDFLDQIPAIVNGLQETCSNFLEAKAAPTQLRRIEDLRRKIGFLTHMTSMAGWRRLAQLSSSFEALLYELQLKPASLNDSSRHTVSSTVALLADSLVRGDPADDQCQSPTNVLVVDDDEVSIRALAMTLDHANVSTTTVSDPFKALEKLNRNSYDAVLLDINLPGMSGLMLCEQMRGLPLHQNTPVIFVTSYLEFEPLARAILGKGDDLIGKPIMPIELTVKLVAHILRRRLAQGTERVGV